MPQLTEPVTDFRAMPLSPAVFTGLNATGYETPTPIQALTIPHIFAGKDILGQARTGTGKTAAFALPLLSRVDLSARHPQILVLTPTRELAIQVAESFTTYGKALKGLNVLAVYGGQSYGIQLTQLRRGVHVVVGTPGRIMDHLRRKTLNISDIFCRVVDEADEMLQMGFIDDVEWILDQTPAPCQTALFSATMPLPIQKIADKHLKDPQKILIRPQSEETGTISQQFWIVTGASKAQALVRILSAASFDGAIVFSKTRSATLDIARNLEENGFKAEALNGEMAQAARERTITRLKSGAIDILVATDVAARGLDVSRVSHVINYDMPPQVEPYIHRIGRTGRAGRNGEAILFVSRNERWMIKKIEQATRQSLTEIALPSPAAVTQKRITDFKASIGRIMASEDLTLFESVVRDYAQENDLPVERVAAALARMAHGTRPLIAAPMAPAPDIPAKPGKARVKVRQAPATPSSVPLDSGMERFRIEVGQQHGVRPGDIVGAIANEAGLESRFIRRIHIGTRHSLVDLPAGMPRETFNLLKQTWIRSRPLGISRCA